MYPSVAEAGITFTSVGVITADPASVESVLAWASRLRDRTAYLIVENSTTEHSDFRYWRETHQALLFQETYSPAIVRIRPSACSQDCHHPPRPRSELRSHDT